MSGKILIVEDNADEQAIYGALLRHYGYEVVVAWNGLEGIDAALQEKPAVILMDLRMPVMGGISAAQTIQGMRVLAGTPIIGMSVYDVTQSQIRGAGFVEFLPKPVTATRLLSAISRYVGGAEPGLTVAA